MIDLVIPSASEIAEAARAFVQNMDNRRVFAFHGSMGAGKTTFIKAICQELGVSDTVTSPTFAIVNEYRSEKEGDIYHFDLYRVKTLEEVLAIGFEDYIYSGNLCFIEWPEVVFPLLPDDTVNVSIQESESGGRTVTME